MSESNGTIVKAERKPQLSVGSKGLVPDSFDGLWRMAEMASQSTFAPSDKRGKPVECMVAMAHGMEAGLGPMQSLQNIAVINGRPSIWGDAMVGLVLGSGLMVHQQSYFEGTEGTDGYTAVYECQRKGIEAKSVSRYSVADAKRAGLWNKKGPWSQYPNRMLEIRARAFGLRNNFADVLGGLYMAEEWGVTRDTFDPDNMAVSKPSLETKIGSDEQGDEPELELIDEEPERDPDTGEVIPDDLGRDDLFPQDEQKGYV